MTRLGRRALLEGVVALVAPGVLGAGCDVDAAPAPAGPVCDRFAGGEILGLVPFTNEGGPLDTAFGAGLDGRLYTDLSKLAPERLVTPNDTHYIRTRASDLLDTQGPWTIAVHGRVRAPATLDLGALAPLVVPDLGPFVMECSGNARGASFGLMSAALWSGAPMKDVLAKIDALPDATRVLVSGFDTYGAPPRGSSTPGASWIFRLDDLAEAFLATAMNGAPLPLDHGSPVRLFVPGWYGCSSIKWVDEIVLVGDDEPATSQMKEFAQRTHQSGVPDLARDYRPATIDQAAMPVRIERWRVGGRLVHRVVGIMWGGSRTTDALTIRFAPTEPFVPVDRCYAQTTNRTWTLFTHAWTPARPGSYAIACAIADRSIPTKRLDAGYYVRTLDVAET